MFLKHNELLVNFLETFKPSDRLHIFVQGSSVFSFKIYLFVPGVFMS